ncbi:MULTISPECIES: LysR family transcriptional regulator [Providencia]|uniref:LysR family transcriptional regulator n=1 Tax=Providencia TaxID=586 RepID=UPI001B36F6E1|nr:MULTISPECIES: LysR family transcriptional regulator [Providencia]MBQ0366288.1 LysR family transcriptional regulator [Providencia rettgeri]
MNNLRKLDLNQLVTLLVLLRERHVSRAAEVLHKSQPAVSHTLNQLRELFQDPLLVRQQGQYQLTSKAGALYEPLLNALEQLDYLISQQNFRPELCHRQFNIALSDYGAAIITLPLTRYLRLHAPDVDLKIWHCSREEMQTKLQEGSLDLAFGVFNSLDNTLHTQSIFQDQMVSVADKSICPKGAMELNEWLSYPHVAVSMKPFDANEVDIQLKRLNQQRRVAVTVPYWQVAPQLIENTDLILTVAQKVFSQGMNEQCVMFEPPIEIPLLDFQMIWHERSDTDNALSWLRNTISGLLQS